MFGEMNFCAVAGKCLSAGVVREKKGEVITGQILNALEVGLRSLNSLSRVMTSFSKYFSDGG